MIGQCDPYMIQAFERAHGSGAYGNGATVMVDQFLDCIPVDGYIFRVHLVSFNFLAFHRLKSSCPYVQCQFLKVYAFFLQCFQYSRGEMQSGSRCGYRTFYFGVNSLICFLVAFLRIPVQIGWDRKLSEDVYKRQVRCFLSTVMWLDVPSLTPDMLFCCSVWYCVL